MGDIRLRMTFRAHNESLMLDITSDDWRHILHNNSTMNESLCSCTARVLSNTVSLNVLGVTLSIVPRIVPHLSTFSENPSSGIPSTVCATGGTIYRQPILPSERYLYDTKIPSPGIW
jgi:hypothetical protein